MTKPVEQRAEEAISTLVGICNMSDDTYIHEMASHVAGIFSELRTELTTITAERDGLRAKVDALMFEYCPDDMTAKQIHDYGIAQHRVGYLEIPAFLRKDCDKGKQQ